MGSEYPIIKIKNISSIYSSTLSKYAFVPSLLFQALTISMCKLGAYFLGNCGPRALQLLHFIKQCLIPYLLSVWPYSLLALLQNGHGLSSMVFMLVYSRLQLLLFFYKIYLSYTCMFYIQHNIHSC